MVEINRDIEPTTYITPPCVQAYRWFAITRPAFLLGSVALALLGISIAWWSGFFDFGFAMLTVLGLLLWHTSVNVLNDYYDYRSGIDFQTNKTPFSGGSGILTAGLLKSESVLKFGLLLFITAIPIWVYFTIAEGLLLLPLLVVGALCVLLYTPVLTRLRLPEISSGIGIGALPILAFYFIQSGAYSWEAGIIAVASGLLMFNVHLLNEFPDVEADTVGGRRTLPIILGRHKASFIYATVTLAFYAWILYWAANGIMPQTTLLSLITLPLAIYVVMGALKYKEQRGFVHILWISATTYFLTMVLLSLGLIIDGL